MNSFELRKHKPSKMQLYTQQKGHSEQINHHFVNDCVERKFDSLIAGN